MLRHLAVLIRSLGVFFKGGLFVVFFFLFFSFISFPTALLVDHPRTSMQLEAGGWLANHLLGPSPPWSLIW